ncbi:hypothetical protein PENSUB_5051, partial [Penicillium subrubescens]
MTESTFQANVVFDFAAIQAQAHASTTVNGSAINSGKWCVDCTTAQAEATYIAAIPPIVMQLMIRDDKDVAANDMSSGSPIKSNIVQFLNAAKGESSLFVLKQ